MAAPTTRWSTLRSQLSDWRSGNQNFSRNLVSPLDQATEVLDHPLPMESLDEAVGLAVLGFDPMAGQNRLPIVNYNPAIVPNPVPFVPVMQTWMEFA